MNQARTSHVMLVSGLFLGTAALAAAAGPASGGPGAEIQIDSVTIRDFFLADINGDGHQDIVATHGESSTSLNDVFHYLGDGQGGFQAAVTIGTLDSRAYNMTPGDLDGDGDIDFVVNHSSVDWWRNDGAGQFALVNTLYDDYTAFSQLLVEDADGDGDLDVLLCRAFLSDLLWIENRGVLGFASVEPLVSQPLQSSHYAVSDVDGDGDPDLVQAARLDDRIRWIENTGGGVFGPRHLVVLDGPIHETLGVGDLDGDGDDDVVYSTGGSDELRFVTSDGTGGFAESQSVSAPMPWPSDLHFVDLDGDGDADLVSASELDDRVAWHENFGGVFGPQQVLSQSADEVDRLRFGDVDGDGVEDLFYAGTNGLFMHRSGGEPADARRVVLAESIHGMDWLIHDIDTGDLDGDGDLDMLYVRQGFQQLYWRENLGALGFDLEEPLAMPPFFFPRRIRAADLDGDGDEDLLSLEHHPADELAWFENLGMGAFGPRRVLSSVETAGEDVAAADLDLDGDLDVISLSGGRRAVFENLGQGLFGPAALLDPAFQEGGSELKIADLDSDGLPDIVMSRGDATARSVTWYRNRGAVAFDDGRGIGAGSSGRTSMVVRDLDGDGDHDVAYASQSGDELWTIENLGGLQFAAPVLLSAGIEWPSELDAADVNVDGVLDLILGRTRSGRVVWLEGGGDLTFGAPQPLGATGRLLSAIHSADFDGDGDEDFALGSFWGAMITLYENAHSGRVGTAFCPAAVPNSTGAGAALECLGHVAVDLNDLTLRASSLPANAFGFFIVSQTSRYAAQPGGSLGSICLGGSSVGRYVGPGEVQNAGSGGVFSLQIDLTSVPQPLGAVAVQVGESWLFQAWYRDFVGGAAVSNFTEAVRVPFL